MTTVNTQPYTLGDCAFLENRLTPAQRKPVPTNHAQVHIFIKVPYSVPFILQLSRLWG